MPSSHEPVFLFLAGLFEARAVLLATGASSASAALLAFFPPLPNVVAQVDSSPCNEVVASFSRSLHGTCRQRGAYSSRMAAWRCLASSPLGLHPA